MPWQIFASCLQRPSAKMTSSCSNTTSSMTEPDRWKPWKGTVVEIHVPAHIDFKWNRSNLDNGRKLGRAAAEQAIAAYKATGTKTAAENEKVRFINENPKEDKKARAVLSEYLNESGWIKIE